MCSISPELIDFNEVRMNATGTHDDEVEYNLMTLTHFSRTLLILILGIIGGRFCGEGHLFSLKIVMFIIKFDQSLLDR